VTAPVIDYYVSPVSSYSYLAGLRLEEIAARHGARISYRPLDIVALFARTGGLRVAERHPSRQSYRAEDLARLAARAGLPMNQNPRHRLADPGPAAMTIIAAQTAGGGDVGGLTHAILRAYWAEEADISDPGLLARLLGRHGFDPGLDIGPDASANYAHNLDEAVARGVFGAPFYIAGGARFWGQDRLSFLDDHLAGLS
jgi:2-hydroxychromene-2-carboxylate isomerase